MGTIFYICKQHALKEQVCCWYKTYNYQSIRSQLTFRREIAKIFNLMRTFPTVGILCQISKIRANFDTL